MALIVSTCRALLRWWGAALASLIPARLRSWLASRRTVSGLEVRDQRLVVTRRKGARATRVVDLDLASLQAPGARTAVRRTLRRLQRRDGLLLTVAARRVLRRRFRLPMAARENLREVVGFELDRHTPFRAEEVFFDHRVTGASSDTGQLDVEAIVVARQETAAARGVLADLGLAADGVLVGPPDGPVIPVADPGPRLAPGYRVAVGLGVIALGLGAGAAYLSIVQKADRLAALDAAVASARSEAMAADAMRAAVTAATARERYLFDLKARTPMALAVVDTLSATLPDHATALQMGLTGRTVSVTGYAANASGLLQLLEQTPDFANAAFQSPVTEDPSRGAERFHIRVEVAQP